MRRIMVTAQGKAIVVGGNALYLKDDTVPPIYEELQYLQSGGGTTGAYIDTGFKPTINTQFEVKFRKASTSNMYVYGQTNSANTASFTIYLTSGSGNWRFGNKYASKTTSTNTDYVGIVDKTGASLNGTKTDFADTTVATVGGTLLLGTSKAGNGTPGTSNRFNGRMYYFKIWDDGEIVRNYVPVRRLADSVVGWYDKANDTFTPSAANAYTAGPVVE